MTILDKFYDILNGAADPTTGLVPGWSSGAFFAGVTVANIRDHFTLDGQIKGEHQNWIRSSTSFCKVSRRSPRLASLLTCLQMASDPDSDDSACEPSHTPPPRCSARDVRMETRHPRAFSLVDFGLREFRKIRCSRPSKCFDSMLGDTASSERGARKPSSNASHSKHCQFDSPTCGRPEAQRAAYTAR